MDGRSALVQSRNSLRNRRPTRERTDSICTGTDARGKVVAVIRLKKRPSCVHVGLGISPIPHRHNYRTMGISPIPHRDTADIICCARTQIRTRYTTAHGARTTGTTRPVDKPKAI
jgi:hypothetical protein